MSQTCKKTLESCINSLRQRYRQLSFIQNDNHATIDFTIAFITLKSVLEKHGDLIPQAHWKWNGLSGTELKHLKLNIADCVRYICNAADRATQAREENCIDLAKSFRDIFHYEADGRTFSFVASIERFQTPEHLAALKGIYDEINDLPALHSSRIDLFGETYELLADKKTKAAFGQFFTGRHIIRPLIRLLLDGETSQTITGGIKDEAAINPRKFCDPACGTGGFLTEALKHVRDLFAKQTGTPLDVNKFARQAFFGYDIFPANVTKTKINLYLAGDGFSELDTRNTLTARVTEQFDYIITNPPYGAGEILVNPDIIGSNRLEVNFLVRIVEMLKVGGKALIVLPDGIFESPSLSGLREWLIKQCSIDKIIGLPKFAFAPYTKEKTYALFVTKREVPLDSLQRAADRNERAWCYIVDNDGYANSDKRFPTGRKDAEGRWLHDEFSDWVDKNGEDRDCLLISRWRQVEQAPNAEFFDEWGKPIPGKKFGHVSIAEVLSQEFASFENVSKTTAFGIVKKATTPEIGSLEDGDYEKYGIRVQFDGKGKRSFVTAEGIPLTDAAAYKNVLAGMRDAGAIPAKAENLFDEDGAIRPEFNDILLESDIFWDESDKVFSNQGKQKVTKLLNLLPEKYFREQKIERILIGDLAVEIDQVEADFQALLAEIMSEVVA